MSAVVLPRSGVCQACPKGRPAMVLVMVCTARCAAGSQVTP
jgi:hypothetical protein